MRLFKWLYHYIAWKWFAADYRKHQCPHLEKAGREYTGEDYFAACTRVKDHFGKHDIWV